MKEISKKHILLLHSYDEEIVTFLSKRGDHSREKNNIFCRKERKFQRSKNLIWPLIFLKVDLLVRGHFFLIFDLWSLNFELRWPLIFSSSWSLIFSKLIFVIFDLRWSLIVLIFDRLDLWSSCPLVVDDSAKSNHQNTFFEIPYQKGTARFLRAFWFQLRLRDKRSYSKLRLWTNAVTANCDCGQT